MDSDDEVMAAMLLEEEDAIAEEEDENLVIVACLLQVVKFKPTRPPLLPHQNERAHRSGGRRPS